MESEIIVGIITALGAVICQIIIARTNAERAKVARLENQQIILYRIDKLEEKVNKHNNLIDRTYKLERDSDLHEEQLKVANHRIQDLEAVRHEGKNS